MRCLIVDDNEAFLDAARLLLELEGLDVVGTAGTPAEGLEEAARLQPDVVLVDVMLGDQRGFDLAWRLNERGIAVVMISTHSVADLADLLLESPARGFLPKSQLSATAVRELVEGS
jgi:two-component system nitrate/nitrite response regulator NarL